MAKKKKYHPRTPSGALALTDEQVKSLADRLRGTRGNVYSLARLYFGVDAGDEVFDLLWKKAGLCKCALCDSWKDKEKFLPAPSADEAPDICLRCADGDSEGDWLSEDGPNGDD